MNKQYFKININTSNNLPCNTFPTQAVSRRSYSQFLTEHKDSCERSGLTRENCRKQEARVPLEHLHSKKLISDIFYGSAGLWIVTTLTGHQMALYPSEIVFTWHV